jgi:hypothetical protein
MQKNSIGKKVQKGLLALMKPVNWTFLKIKIF